MAVDILTDGEVYYLRQRGGGAAVGWRRGDAGWEAARATLPGAAAPTTFEQVPADLREELLAFMARASSVGDVWRALE